MQFIDYHTDHKEIITQLLSSYSHPRYQRDPRLWDWFYRDNPFIHANSKLGISIVEGSEQEVIGYNGLMPQDIFYRGKILSGAWSFDTILSPKCRGKGLGKKLALTIKSSSPLVLGLGISEIQASIMRKIGYSINTDIEQLFLTRKTKTARDIAKQILQIGKKGFRRLIPKSYCQRYVSAIECQLIKADRHALNKKEVDALWEKVKSSYHKCIVRDHDYFHWKYSLYPPQCYEYILVRFEGQLVGLGVINPNHEKARLVDFLGDANDYRTKLAIVKQFIRRCPDAELLECTSTDKQMLSILKDFGFRPYREKPHFYVATNLEGDASPELNWFVMGGDSD